MGLDEEQEVDLDDSFQDMGPEQKGEKNKGDMSLNKEQEEEKNLDNSL